MAFKLTTAPASEPVTLQEAKDHLRIDDTNEDALISELIKAAREYAESAINRPLITQTWTYYADCFESVIELKPNLQSVSTVKYIDTDGTQQTLAATEYAISTSDIVGTLFEDYDKTWPSIRSIKNAIEVEFIAGYGLAADVPASIKSAMLLLIGHWFVNREAVIVGVNATNTPMAVDLLLGPYRVVTF